MKKLAFIALAAFAFTATAAEYHTYTTLICSDCHTMHAQRTHSFGSETLNANDTVVFGAGDTGGHEALLLGADANRTCLVCHNGARGPDVFGTNSSSYALQTRSAGALNAATGYAVANEDGYLPYMGHSLGSMDMPPGRNPAIYAYPGDMQCVRCHTAHGRPSYRNLRDRGSDAVVREPSYVVLPSAQLTMNFGYDVNLFGNDYSADSVVYTSAVGSTNGQNKMTAFCGMCHGNYHDDIVGGTAPNDYFRRHPTDQITLTARQIFTAETANATNVSVKLTYIQGAALNRGAEGGVNFASDPTATATVGCLTCHKAHGNLNSFGLFFPGNSVGPTGANVHQGDANKEQGGGTSIRNLCNTCHSQGRTPVAAFQ